MMNEFAAHCAELAAVNNWNARFVRLQESGDEDSLRDHIGSKLALIHSEVSEALEKLREVPLEDLGTTEYASDGKPISFGSELADIIIRVAHLAHLTGVDLDRDIQEKLTYNRGRGSMHGGKKL